MLEQDRPLWIRHANGEVIEYTPLSKFPLQERILVAGTQQPFFSVPNMTARLRVPGVRDKCKALVEEGLLEVRGLGVIRTRAERYVVTGDGVEYLRSPARYGSVERPALALTRQMTEEGLKRELERIPMLEVLYELVGSWHSNGIILPYVDEFPYGHPAFTNRACMYKAEVIDVKLLSRGRLHAVVSVCFLGSGGELEIRHIPVVWSGLLPQEGYQGRSLREEEFFYCPKLNDGYGFSDEVPPVVVIGTDMFAAWRAPRAYGEDIAVAAVDTDNNVLWALGAICGEWVQKSLPQAGPLGQPENAIVESAPDIINLKGVRSYRAADYLADFRGATRIYIERAFRMSPTSKNEAVDDLVALGIAVETKAGHIYLTQQGVGMIAKRDRVNPDRLVEVTYLDPNGDDARRELGHDDGVAQLGAEFLHRKYPAVAGWREIMAWPDGQIVPDLWVLVPVPGTDRAVWVPVEFERTARGESRIRRKLRNYKRLAARLKLRLPLLVVTEDALPATRFDAQAGGLVMLTTTLKELVPGAWEGPNSVWRRNGERVSLSEVTRGSLGRLWQDTGVKVDKSGPGDDFWERMIGGESGCEAPYGTSGIPGFSVRRPPDVPPTTEAEPVPVNDVEATETEAVESAGTESGLQPPADTVQNVADSTFTAEASLGLPRHLDERPERYSKDLAEISTLIDAVDAVAAERLRNPDLLRGEFLSLARLRGIIAYGMGKQIGVNNPELGRQAVRCLTWRDSHIGWLDSANPVWRRVMAPWLKSPEECFRMLVGRLRFRAERRDACRLFNEWSGLVDQVLEGMETVESGN